MTESSLCTIMTYNMSFTTQMNESTFGSEKDFVERCQHVYKRGGLQCTDNAIKKIGTLQDLDLLALQEVQSDLESKIINSNLPEDSLLAEMIK